MTDAEVKLKQLVGELADERVLIAVLPEMPDPKPTDVVRLDDKTQAVAVTFHYGHQRLLDLHHPSKGFRWWQVVAYARQEGLDTIPTRYDGPAADIPERYLLDHPGEVVLLRLASRGPWFQLERRPLPPPEARGRGL